MAAGTEVGDDHRWHDVGSTCKNWYRHQVVAGREQLLRHPHRRSHQLHRVLTADEHRIRQGHARRGNVPIRCLFWDAMHEVLRIEEPMALSEALKMVMSFDETRVTKKELLTSCPAWRAFPLQDWTEHVASAELESKWLPNGLQTEVESLSLIHI